MYVILLQLMYYEKRDEADKQMKTHPGNKEYQRIKNEYDLVSHAFYMHIEEAIDNRVISGMSQFYYHR